MSRGKSVIRALYVPSLERYVTVSKQTIDEINSYILHERKDQRFTHYLRVDESYGGLFYEIKLKDNEKKESNE